jgi:hypothetical protein
LNDTLNLAYELLKSQGTIIFLHPSTPLPVGPSICFLTVYLHKQYVLDIKGTGANKMSFKVTVAWRGIQ